MFKAARVLATTFVIVLLAGAYPAHAQKRIGLVIGNQGYAEAVGPLKNPHKDIALVATALVSLGFDVDAVKDGSFADIQQAVNRYTRALRAAGPGAIGFLYYSGHGAQDQASGINYLIPADVRSADDERLWDRSIPLADITRKLKSEAGNAVHFVVFDACRNALRLVPTGKRALVQPRGFMPLMQESGMLVAYATAEGELATDLGTYASILAEEIVKPGVEAVVMFRRVQVRVRASVGQEPWLGFGSLGEIHLAGLAPAAAPLPPAQPPVPQSEAERAWERIKDSTDRDVLRAFIDQFGTTVYGAMARSRLAGLQPPAKQVTPPAEPKARPGIVQAAPPPPTKSTPAPALGFDGVWSVSHHWIRCGSPNHTTYRVTIRGGSVQGVSNPELRGTVSPNGAIQFSYPLKSWRNTFTGTLRGRSGSGKASSFGPGANCEGEFTMTRR